MIKFETIAAMMDMPEDTEIKFSGEIRDNVCFNFEQLKHWIRGLRGAGKGKKPAIENFDNRPIVIDPIHGDAFTSDSIVILTSYPYGWHHRCIQAHWMDDNKNGNRHVHVTSKWGGGYCAPKASTYFAGVRVWNMTEENKLEGNFFCQNDAYEYAERKYIFYPEKAATFAQTNDAKLTERQKTYLANLEKWAQKKIESFHLTAL